MYTLQDP